MAKKKPMLFIDWKPITETDHIPPFGDEFAAHINSYKGKVRQASCSAWNLLYQMLIRMNIPPCHVAFSETGKPYFADADLCFSILKGTSKDVCVAAVADRQIGVDVEVIKDDYRPHLIDRTPTEREKEEFDGDFTRVWCRKEDLVKMSGEGIKSYPFNIDTTEKAFREKRIAYNGARYWIVSILE